MIVKFTDGRTQERGVGAAFCAEMIEEITFKRHDIEMAVDYPEKFMEWLQQSVYVRFGPDAHDE